MSLIIRMFGEYSMRVDGESVAIADKPRFQQVLAYLILHHDRTLARAQIAFAMWPDTAERQAQSNFRNLLFRLRKFVPGIEQCLQIDQTSIRWQPQIQTQVDLLEFQNLLTTAGDTADQHSQMALYEAAVQLYRGNLLPDLYDDWVLVHQERCRDLYASALQQLATAHESRREYEAAHDYVRQLVAHDPLQERYHCQLMHYLMLLGDRAAALHAFHDCQAILQRELGIDPDEQILALYDRLIAGERPAAEWGEPSPVVRNSLPVAGATHRTAPMVGRLAEWAQLKHIYQTLPTDHPQLALIAGVAGIGKTRLAEEFLHWASHQGITTAIAHCYVAQRQTAYAPLVAWLRSGTINSGLSALSPVWLNELSRLLPEMVERFPDLPGPAPMQESWQRLRLFEAIARALWAAPEPMVLLLDDIQWVDPETLEWLQFFFNNPAQGRVLVLTTQRLEEVGAGHPTLIWQRELTRRGRALELVLDGLPDEDVQQLCQEMLGSSLDGETRSRIVAVAEGSPLFVSEMARARQAQGNKPAATDGAAWAALSTTIQSTIVYRLEHLTAETRQLIELASVIGREFTFDLLNAASDAEQPALIQALDEAWRKHIVREQGTLSYDFSHDLIRVAAYNSMSATQRQIMHRSVATALTEMADQQAGQIAVHYEKGLMPANAIKFYRLAAEQAQATYANAEAADFYRHLLDSPLAVQLLPVEHFDIRLALCTIDRASGDWSAALTGYQMLLEEAAAGEDVGMQAQVEQGMANVIRLQGEYDQALDWLASAISNFEHVGDAAGMARALWTMGEVYWYQGRYEEAMTALQRQLDLARDHDSPRDICDATGTMGIVTWSMGRHEESEHYCRQSVELAKELGDKRAEARALITIGNTYISRKEMAQAAAWYRQTMEVAQQADDPQCIGWAVGNLGEICHERREFETALACTEYSVALGVQMGDWWTVALTLANIARIAAGQHAWCKANHAFDVAVAMGERLQIPYLSGMYNDYVRALLKQDNIGQADALHQKAMRALARTEGAFAGGEDVGFLANLNTIRLGAALATLSTDSAVSQLTDLLPRYTETEHQARIHHTIWRLDSRRQSNRQQAITLCQAHYQESQTLTLFEEYHDLTGQALPPLDPLLELPDDLLVPLLSMAEVFQSIERWLAA